MAEDDRDDRSRYNERGEGGGSIRSPLHTRPPNSPSIDALTPEFRRRTQPWQRIGSSYAATPIAPPFSRQPTSDLIALKTPKRPGNPQRKTSMQGPYKRQEFSADDAKDEVAEEMERQRQQAKAASGSLRRQPSTLRRRPTAQMMPTLPRLESSDNEDEPQQANAEVPTEALSNTASSEEEGTVEAEEETGIEDDDADLSDAESFTLKDRQEAINETHPFGIRIWKPALYKKIRSVGTNAEGDVHSTPGGNVGRWLVLFNLGWTVLFGWWLALVALAGGIICLLLGFAPGCSAYGNVLLGLSGYLFYPFGKYVKLMQDEAYAEEDEGEGRSISEYEQWQSGDLEEGRLFFGPVHLHRSLIGRRRTSIDSADETESLLSRGRARSHSISPRGGKNKRRWFGRGQWDVGRIIFFVFFYGLLTPLLFIVSTLCWLMVFTIPMGKVTLLLLYHLRRHPLALSFHSDTTYSRSPGAHSSSIVVCTYRAVGPQYWKYTIDGTNIFLFNLLSVVAFVILDYWVLDVALGVRSWLTQPGFLFTLTLFSIVPLAYFIGQAVASISAQSTMGVGAAINAFFSTIVEVFLYCVALKEGKAQLVEGSIIGSIFAGILFLPGISMCFGAIRRKTQRFNVKSAGVTSTMLLFAVIGAFGPTLFYKIYGSHQLNCHQCVPQDASGPDRDCRQCYFSQIPAVNDRFFNEAVKPYIWFAAILLFLSYVIGLLFTLRTHAAVIWSTEMDEKKLEKMDNAARAVSQREQRPVQHGSKPGSIIGTLPRSEIRDSQLYKRVLGQSLKQVGLDSRGNVLPDGQQRVSSSEANDRVAHCAPPSGDGDHVDSDARSQQSLKLQGLTQEQNNTIVRQVAEMAATAAVVAARDVSMNPRKASYLASTPAQRHPSHATHMSHGHSNPDGEQRPHTLHQTGTYAGDDEEVAAEAAQPGGHDAPNWSRMKSAVILLTATLAYAIIAEILVNTVDVVLQSVDIDEKFLGITLFALVPNTTEFLNAISFAMNGNIALSMEIGSAYALQVCLLQIPALVLFSAFFGRYVDPDEVINHTFTLIFPQWDMITVILCVFLLSYMYGEGKSNYFKGSILILSYLVVVVGFYFSGYNNVDVIDARRFGMKGGGSGSGGVQTFMTVGRGRDGRAY